MHTKLQQFYILKFSSDRLKDCGNNLDIDLKEARKNGEVISLGESEEIRIINRLKEREINYSKINQLIKEKRKLKKEQNNFENRKKILEIDNQIDSYLFVPEVINIVLSDARHYKKLVDNLYVNGKRFTRFLAGSGMLRRNTIQFVQEDFAKILRPILDCDRDKTTPLNLAKYNAYFGLCSSATYSVSTPRFAVVKDYEITRNTVVDFVRENEGEEDSVETIETPILFSTFDGQGMISKEYAEEWALELGLKFVPNAYIFRGAFAKGLLVSFNFHKFSKDFAGKSTFVDVWGNEIDINDVDCILTASQVKLWSSYKNCQDYQEKCEKNNFGWGVSRWNPRNDKDTFLSSYQFLQVLNLNKEQIVNLCEPTISWLRKIAGGDVEYALLYLLGKICEFENSDDLPDDFFNQLEPINQALLLNKDLFGDGYIKKTLYQNLNKKIKEARLGKILINGNWQFILFDMFALCEHVFGLPVKGLLKEKEYYSYYWNKKGSVSKIIAGRSPLTWKSEFNELNLVSSEVLDEWFGHLRSGIIHPCSGNDLLYYADGDGDGDLIASTDNKYFAEGMSGGNPVSYERKNSKKEIVDENKLWEIDLRGVGSKIGLITNVSSSLYSLETEFDKDSKEYKTLIDRLIIIRKIQGSEIDKIKVGLPVPMPKWDKFIHEKENETPEEKEKREIHNKLVVTKRPLFMKNLYPKLLKSYRTHQEIYENYCQCLYGSSLNDLINKTDRSQSENEIYRKYVEFNPLINTNSVMCQISRYMEQNLSELKLNLKDAQNFDYKCLVSDNYNTIIKDTNKINKIKELYKKYKEIKKNKRIYQKNENEIDDEIESLNFDIDEINKEAYQTISSNGSELADLAVYLCYQIYSSSSRDFVWNCFGEETVQNLYNNYYQEALVPMRDDFAGNIEYLGGKYSLARIKINLDKEGG